MDQTQQRILELEIVDRQGIDRKLWAQLLVSCACHCTGKCVEVTSPIFDLQA